MRLAVALAVALAAAALAGCGGDSAPRLARADAAPLIALGKQIAREGRCAQARDIRRLQARTIALVNGRRVPAAMQEPLLSGVNQLAARAPVCTPRVAPADSQHVETLPVETQPVPPARSDEPGGRREGKHHPPKHGHGHGR